MLVALFTLGLVGTKIRLLLRAIRPRLSRNSTSTWSVGGVLSTGPQAGVVGMALLLAGCSEVPAGQPIDDPDTLALLRPAEPIVHEELTRSHDGWCYYSATLRGWPVPGFRKRYLEELEDRGFSIWPSGTSAYGVDLPPTTGYNVDVIQETTLKPYAVRYRRVWQRDDPDLWRLRWNARHPLSVSGRSVTVRLPAEFLKPWKTVILVPDQNLVEPSFPLPLPPSAAVVKVNWSPPSRPVQVFVDVVAKIPPETFVRFYRERLSGSGSPKFDSPGKFVLVFTRQRPTWVPEGAEDFAVIPDDALSHEVPVRDARHLLYKPPNKDDNGTYTAKSLKHIPPDAYMYSVRVGLKHERFP